MRPIEMPTPFSVILCTHNPRQEYLRRALNSFKPLSSAEMLIAGWRVTDRSSIPALMRAVVPPEEVPSSSRDMFWALMVWSGSWRLSLSGTQMAVDLVIGEGPLTSGSVVVSRYEDMVVISGLAYHQEANGL